MPFLLQSKLRRKKSAIEKLLVDAKKLYSFMIQFKVLLVYIQKKMGCKLLSSKLQHWFDENMKKREDLKFRFRGQESAAFLKHFPALILYLKEFITHIIAGTAHSRL